MGDEAVVAAWKGDRRGAEPFGHGDAGAAGQHLAGRGSDAEDDAGGNAGLVSRRKTGRTTYLILNSRRLRVLQGWAGQFHTYWGSDEASFENYHSYLGNDPDDR